jgi:plastocyanin
MGSARAVVVVSALLAAILCTDPAVGARAAGAGQVGGTISGTVHVETRSARRLATAGVYPGRAVVLPAERDTSELDNVVVFVERSGPTASPPTRAVVRQNREEFVPHLVAVTTGSTVEFPNDDLIFHNVFSLSRAATFDLGRYPRNESREETFREPGIVKVFCHLHSHMSAIVRVFDHPYFVIPDRDGRFSIPGVPAGTHRVTAWHERVGDVTHEVTLRGGGTAGLAFSLPLADD